MRSFQIIGLELGPDVIDWGALEETKEVLLAKSQLFVGEISLILQNSRSQYSYDNAASPFRGKRFLNLACSMSVDGEILFRGRLKDISLNHETRHANFILENELSKPSESSVVLTGSALNPASAMIALFESVGLGDLLDRGSFFAAGGPSAQAGAVIGLNFTAGKNVTLMDAIQQIGELASISVFVSQASVRALAFRPFQGNFSGLRAEISSAVTREFRSLKRAYQSFNNKVIVNYGASGSFTGNDGLSQGETGVVKPFQFATASTEAVSVPDLASATFFGQTFLSRAATIRKVIDLKVGSAFNQTRIGDRHPVTAPHWGLSQAPFEVIEVHRQIQENSVILTLASL